MKKLKTPSELLQERVQYYRYMCNLYQSLLYKAKPGSKEQKSRYTIFRSSIRKDKGAVEDG